MERAELKRFRSPPPSSLRTQFQVDSGEGEGFDDKTWKMGERENWPKREQLKSVKRKKEEEEKKKKRSSWNVAKLRNRCQRGERSEEK